MCQPTSNIRIGYPEFELEPEHWAEHFAEMNSDWLANLHTLRAEFSNMMVRTYEELNQTEHSSLQTKHLIRALKFSIYRLATIGFGNENMEVVLKLLIEQPSTLAVKLIGNALAYQGFNEILFSAYNQSTFSFVKALLLRSMAEAENITQAITLFWSVLEDENTSEIEKLMASEALLVCDIWHPNDDARVLTLIKSDPDSYLLKNYILVCCRINKLLGKKLPESIISLQYQEHPTIVVDAVQHALRDDCSYIFDPPEPLELIDCYSCFYPDTEGELEHGQYYGGLFHS